MKEKQNLNIEIELVKVLKSKEYLIIEYILTEKENSNNIENFLNKNQELIHEISIDNKNIKEEKQIIEKISQKQLKKYIISNIKNIEIKNDSKISLNIYKTSNSNNHAGFTKEYNEKIEYTDEDYEEITEYANLYSENQQGIKQIPEHNEKIKEQLIEKISIKINTCKLLENITEKEIIEKSKKIEGNLIIEKITIIKNIIITVAKIKQLTSDIIYDEAKMSPLNIHTIIENNAGKKPKYLKEEQIQILLKDGTDWINSLEDEFTNGTAILKSYIILQEKNPKLQDLKIQYISNKEVDNEDTEKDIKQTVTEEIGKSIEINL